MADTKTAKTAKDKSVKLVKKPDPQPEKKDTSKPEPKPEAFWLDPERVGQMLHHRPAWVDELAAIGCIVIGIVSLLALFDTSPTAVGLSHSWATFIAQFFGYIGAVMLCIMIMSAGVLMALPRIGVHIHIPWLRILMIEIAYLAFLGLLHLFAHDPEPRLLARTGQGGGYIGWALSEPVSKLLGSGVTIFLFGSLMIIAIANGIGLRRKHVRQGIQVAVKPVGVVQEHLRREPLHVRISKGVAAINRGLEPVRTAMANRAVASAAAREERSKRAARPDVRVRPARVSQTMPAAAEPEPLNTAAVESLPAPAPLPTLSAMPTALAQETPPVYRPQSESVPVAEPPSEPISTPIASTPVARKPISKPSAPVVEPPPRRIRHFTVEDFRETRVPIEHDASLPSMNLLSDLELNKPTEQEINNNARIIENTLLEFDIDVEVVEVSVGPTVTQYAVQPFREVTNEQGEVVLQRVRVNKIASLSSDLALALSAKRLRIQPYVPGRPYMGIEVPNRTPSVVALRPVMESEAFAKAYAQSDPDAALPTRPLTVPLGRDVSGAAFVVDLATMPHLLIAGTTGSGKSVCITALTIALVMNNTPDRMKLVMLDPKMVELTRFNGLPHLLGPVETDIERIIGVLRWATREMDRRYKLLEVEAARNIEAYNRTLGKAREAEQLPYIVILIDEIGDLMLSRPEEMERTLTRLAQMARAVGMHLVVATQRPSVDIITGLIKANFPARISFAVASGVDSRVILDSTGAETLMGRGDMLYLASDAPVPQRLQGCYVSDEELEKVVTYWKNWKPVKPAAAAIPDSEDGAPWERGMTRRESLAEADPLIEDAIDLVVREGEASPSLIQRRLGIGYPRAAQLIDMLTELGVIGPAPQAGRARPVLIKPGTQAYKNLIEKSRG